MSDGLRYEAIAHALLDGITQGRYRPAPSCRRRRNCVPSTAVSRDTVRSAMRQLTDLGLVSRRKGIGTRVEERTARPSGFQQSLASVDDVVQFAEATVRDIRSIETVVMDRRMAQEFNCKPGSRWIKVSYVRTKANGDSRPIGWVDVYIDERFEGVRSALRDYRGMYGSLIEEQYGVRIVEIQQEVRGSLVPEELAEALEAKPGSPALQVVRRYLDRKAELVEFSVSVHQADRYVVSSSLQRVAEAPQDR